MLIHNAQHILKEREYEFYMLEEVGFSNGDFALENNLYEDFGPGWESTYQLIFESEEYFDNKITQIWIYKDNEPIGLCLGVHYLNTEYVKNPDTGLTTELLGHIQLYVKPAHRGQGLSALAVPLLEQALMKRDTLYPPSVVLQDKAYRFKDCVKDVIVLPYGDSSPHVQDNKHFLCEAFKNIFTNNEKLQSLFGKFPLFSEEISFDKNRQHIENVLNTYSTPKIKY